MKSADQVTVTLPAHAVFLPVVRVAGAVMGDQAGLDHADIEDVRLALDELVFLLLGEGRGSIHVTLAAGPGCLEVTARRSGDDAPLGATSRVVSQALVAAVDDYELHDGDRPGFRFHKTRSRPR